MKKFLATIAVALALCAPAAAQPVTPDSIRAVAVVLVAYNTFCAQLGPVNTELMFTLTSALDREKAAADSFNKGVEIKQEGVGRWCARMKPTVDDAERAGQ